MEKTKSQLKTMGRLKQIDRDIHILENINALLQWDQETYMPPAAIGDRAEQVALIQKEIHRGRTTSEMEDLISTAESFSNLNYQDQALVRELRRSFDQEKKMPENLVTAIARQGSINHASWVDARSQSDFNIFRPDLEQTVNLVQDKADCLGFKDTRYDPLLDSFEPGLTSSQLDKVLHSLRAPLVELLQQIVLSPVVIDNSILKRKYDVVAQRAFSEFLLTTLGFSMKTGRLDVSAHPFTTSLGTYDARLTTRFNDEGLNTSIFGTIHECGHGFHGLGVAPELANTQLGDGTSLGICESQSRFWENHIGRNLSFWEYFYPRLQPRFAALANIKLNDFYRAINSVEPSLIRVEADEVTYNLHILLRYNLERRMVEGDLQIADLPDAWREESNALLGIAPERDSDGVLQDIHWSMFLVGYFPTYTLGNLYAAQFHNTMIQEIPDWENQIRCGSFSPILEWLQEKIHRHGRIFSADEICECVTGERLDTKYFINYLKKKYGDLYLL